MNSLIRIVFRTAALAAGLTLLATGCRNATAGTTAAATTGTTAAATTGTTAAPAVAAGRTVYLAEGGSVTGTWLHAPACGSGCVLSGDSTVSLWNMTWSTWSSTTAVGTGTEKLDDCTPNCAQGTLRPVPVTVTLSRPVLVCVAGKGHGTWFWTRTSFTWLAPLPKAFAGGNVPLNPFDYVGLAGQAAKSCP
jgi:hypothetical protein